MAEFEKKLQYQDAEKSKIVDRLAKWAAEKAKKAGQTQDQAQAQQEADKKFKELLGIRESNTKTKAKEWTKKATDKDAATHKLAKAELKKDAYPRLSKSEAQQHLEAARANWTGDFPEWLSLPEKEQSAATLEFTARVLKLKELQSDPNVLYREAARLYDTNWTDLSNEEVVGKKILIGKVLDRAESLRAGQYKDFPPREDLEKGFSRKFDLYRTERMTPPGRDDEQWSKLDRFLRDKQDEIDISDQSLDDERRSLGHIKDQLFKGIEKGDKGPIYNREQVADYVQKIDTRISEINIEIAQETSEAYRERRSEKGMPLSSIMLSRTEALRFIKNPLLFLELYAQGLEKSILEKGFKDDKVHQAIQRFRLLAQYFSSDEYSEATNQIDMDRFFAQDVTKEEREAVLGMRNKLQDVRGSVLAKYSDRLKGVQFLHILSKSSDFAKDRDLDQILDDLGDAGVYGMHAHYGGLSDYALHQIRTIHEEMLNDPETSLQQRSAPEFMEEVIRQAGRRISEEREGWQDQYKESLLKLWEKMYPDEKTRPPFPKDLEILDEGTCRAIAVLGAVSYTAEWLNVEVTVNGAPPSLGEALDAVWNRPGLNSVVTSGPHERWAWLFSWRDQFARKWVNLKKGERMSWNGRALYYIHKDPELTRYALEKTDAIWEKMQTDQVWKSQVKAVETAQANLGKARNEAERRTAQEALDGAGKALKKNVFFIQLKTIFSEYEKPVELLPRGNESAEYKYAHFFSQISNARRWSKLNKDTLYYYVAADIGGEWAQAHGIKPYGFWGSGARRGAVSMVIDKSPIYKDKKGIGIASKILGKANNYFHPVEFRRTQKSKIEFVDAVNEGLKYDPHILYRIYMQTNQREMGKDGAKVFSECTRRFLAIQARLLHLGEGGIDYSRGYDGITDRVIKGAVDEVFEKIKGSGFALTKEQYFAQMETYSASVKAEEFTHMKYMPKFRFILWTHDVPLGQLDQQDLVDISHRVDSEEVAKKVAENPSLNKQIVEFGEGRQGLWRRSWGDHCHVISPLLSVVASTLAQDRKTFLEKGVLPLESSIKQYQTNNDAAIAVIEAEAGRDSVIRVRPEWGPLGHFVKALGGSSKAREAWGPEGQSQALDEVVFGYNEIQAMIGNLREAVPEYANALDSYIGASAWREMPVVGGLVHAIPFVSGVNKARLVNSINEAYVRFGTSILGEQNFDRLVGFLNERLPSGLWTYRGLNTAVFAALIILLIAAEEAKKGGQEGKK